MDANAGAAAAEQAPDVTFGSPAYRIEEQPAPVPVLQRRCGGNRASIMFGSSCTPNVLIAIANIR